MEDWRVRGMMIGSNWMVEHMEGNCQPALLQSSGSALTKKAISIYQ